MDFYELVDKRKSIRKYKPDLVDKAIVGKILEAARMAPTWANMQGVRYIIVSEKEKVENIKAAIGQKWLSSVPMFIVAAIKESDSGIPGAPVAIMLPIIITAVLLSVFKTSRELRRSEKPGSNPSARI